MLWYSGLFQNFPQFIVIHTVKGFGIVNKAEIVVFLELSCFFNDPADVGNLISGSSALDFPGGSDGKSVCLQCGRPEFDPWVGKFPGKGNGNPLQYSALENSMDNLWGHKELDTTLTC